MTLPFRRRHHDDESAHDRARALTSHEMLEPIADDDATWLAGHMEACGECRQDRTAYLADRELLRGLRERTPEPPRDLWARTSAALERESRARHRRAAPPSRRRSLPFGAAAGALLVVVVIGASLVPPVVPPSATPGRSQIAQGTPVIEPTPFEVTAGRVGWIRPAANGSWELVLTSLEAVCPRTRPGCAPLIEDDPARPVNLGGLPSGVTISPNEDQMVFEAQGAGLAPDKIYVMAVPPATPAVTAAPPTVSPSTDVPPTDTPSGEPTETATPPSPDPSAPPPGLVEIASGVVVVGEAAYSSDGAWLAFSARPSDGSTGPDLYLWSAAQLTAKAVTSDHQTYFSGWFNGQVLASRVDVPVAPTASADPNATDSPTTTDTPAAAPTVAPTPVPTTDASGNPIVATPIEAHPASFLLDPATLVRTEIDRPDVWLPVVDPTGRFVAYWSGTLVPSEDGLDWHLGTGQLVLDGWSNGPPAAPAPDPSALPTAEPTETPATPSGEPQPTQAPALGPAGSPAPISTGITATFTAKFDTTGLHLAVWVAEQIDATVGRLQLVVIDPVTGAIEADTKPLVGAPALRGFSITVGRLAWVSPSGQDGQESAVQVLGWSDTEFGEIRTIPAKGLYIVR